MNASERRPMTPVRQIRSRPFGLVLILAALLLVVSLVALWQPSRRTRPQVLTITAGSANGLRHRLAESLATFAEPRGIQLKIIPTAGSEEALQRVEAGEIDLALTQGGLLTTDYANLRQGGVLNIEPLHLLVKAELLDDRTAGVNVLNNRTVNIGPVGSGTHALAREVLEFVGLQPGVDCEITTWKYAELMSGGSRDNLPDAVFTVSSLPSPVARELILRQQYELIELPFSEAFRIGLLGDGRSAADHHIARRRVHEGLIPAFTYRVDPPVPATTVRTLGTRLQLVAHKDVSSAALDGLVETVYETNFAALADPPLAIDLLSSGADFPLHEGVRAYIEKHSPVITGNVVELTEQVLAIVGAVFGGLLFVWQAVLYARRKRRDQQFLDCIERVVAIEEQALQYEFNDDLTIDDLVRIQKEVFAVKAELVAQFQSGDIDGADALSAFLNHANDAGEMLTRMILHERAQHPQASADSSRDNSPQSGDEA